MWVERCAHDRQDSNATKKIAAKKPSGSIAQRTIAVIFVQHASCSACSLRLIYFEYANCKYTASHNLHYTVFPVFVQCYHHQISCDSTNSFHQMKKKMIMQFVDFAHLSNRCLVNESREHTSVFATQFASQFRTYRQKEESCSRSWYRLQQMQFKKQYTPSECNAFLYLWVPDNRCAQDKRQSCFNSEFMLLPDIHY